MKTLKVDSSRLVPITEVQKLVTLFRIPDFTEFVYLLRDQLSYFVSCSSYIQILGNRPSMLIAVSCHSKLRYPRSRGCVVIYINNNIFMA